jgi:hypothetical protein
MSKRTKEEMAQLHTLLRASITNNRKEVALEVLDNIEAENSTESHEESQVLKAARAVINQTKK